MLVVRNLVVSYGEIKAVKGIDLRVENGELVCLIGANGAGKSTTLKTLSGLLVPAAGDIVYDGASIAGLPAYELARKGISLVPEGRGIFGRLSVAENLQLGAYTRNDTLQIKQDIERVYALFSRLSERRNQKAGTLSGGEQQMLAIGRALMNRPKFLLLDEPSMGLAPMLVQKIFAIIKRIAAEGVTLLLVEQNAKLALEVSDRGYVLEGGNIILADSARGLRNNPKVRQAYLGEAI
ncbi:MAG TPA: ABC transporter ATP-binding protein [Acidiferrobacterales bacterium]|nr:ABC transporter ATP-binding protein [Acidiferrobacterales bacterium]